MRRGAPPPSCRLHTADRIVTVRGKRPASVPVVSEAGHRTSAHWHAGCHCTQCRSAHSNSQRAWGRARAQKRLPAEVRQQLLDAIYAGQPFRTVLRDLGLTSNRVFGLTKTEEEWSTQLEAALTPTRRDDLAHGTNAAYVAGCVCSECRERQRLRMARNRG
jgi:Zn ribbon nucleic-acid-binding protein